ncbi:sodium:proton antiporter [Teredinibacter turnerae]|uniref:sodium:proton antiporter n=1 Tax=Teredinibacter turnerae TaxID=2426 RepID=UPI000399EC83|nr:sodium:proton antiporter [Teredinibacter turnerae]
MICDHDELAQAVMFFGENGFIAKEMLYTEFEALLDGYVLSHDWQNRQARAVFVEIDARYRIKTAIFFRIDFNAKGEVDASWNVPLRQLTDNALRGPDLGAGPIRLVCASQCPIKYFQSALWDPKLTAAANQLGALKKAATRNRLGIQFRDDPDMEALPSGGETVNAEQLHRQLSDEIRSEYAKELRNQMALMLKDQRLRNSTLARESEDSIAVLKRAHSEQIEDYRAIIEEKNRALTEEQARNLELKETIDGQAKKIEGLREYFEHKLEKVEGEGTSLVNTLRENHQTEIDAKISAATAELKDLLRMREVELVNRVEEESLLRDEIARLRTQNQLLVSHGGDDILGHMVGAGISFVSYQPGAGHITIPVADIPRYMENASAYAAEQCGVSEERYLAWLEHYQAPVCSAVDENGSMCGDNIARTANPADFHCGDQDRCTAHKDINGNQTLKYAGS